MDLYLIHSSWSLSAIGDLLDNYGPVPFLRIVYDREGQETNRTLALLPPATFTALQQGGYSKRVAGRDFVIHPYQVRQESLPQSGQNQSLYFPLPLELQEAVVREYLEGELNQLVQLQVIPAGSWTVTVPVRSRTTGAVRGGAFVAFPDLPVERVALLRTLLSDGTWPDTEASVRCFWARTSPRPPRTSTTPSLGKVRQPRLRED
jgi:hypothetical protein